MNFLVYFDTIAETTIDAENEIDNSIDPALKIDQSKYKYPDS